MQSSGPPIPEALSVATGNRFRSPLFSLTSTGRRGQMGGMRWDCVRDLIRRQSTGPGTACRKSVCRQDRPPIGNPAQWISWNLSRCSIYFDETNDNSEARGSSLALLQETDPMDTDRNLLFGVLALQADLIDPPVRRGLHGLGQPQRTPAGRPARRARLADAGRPGRRREAARSQAEKARRRRPRRPGRGHHRPGRASRSPA